MHNNSEIMGILRGIHHEICDFKQLYRMDREKESNPPDEKVELTRRVLEAVERAVRAETRAHLWRLVSQLYKAYNDAEDDEEFADACIELQDEWLADGNNVLIWNAAVEIYDNQTEGKPFSIAPTLEKLIAKVVKPT